MTTSSTRRALMAAAAAVALPLLAGCAGSPQASDYAAEKPVLDLRRYFDGDLVAHGIVTDRGGKVIRRFTVDLKGRWQGDEGTLEEDFRYSDGKTERRVWRITRHGDGRYTGRADDVVGSADGRAAGNALNWRYTLRLPVDGNTYEVQFDDWMFLMDERVMLNRATMSKFGIRLAEVTIAFHRK